MVEYERRLEIIYCQFGLEIADRQRIVTHLRNNNWKQRAKMLSNKTLDLYLRDSYVVHIILLLCWFGIAAIRLFLRLSFLVTKISLFSLKLRIVRNRDDCRLMFTIFGSSNNQHAVGKVGLHLREIDAFLVNRDGPQDKRLFDRLCLLKRYAHGPKVKSSRATGRKGILGG
jgi:hypothetical protein